MKTKEHIRNKRRQTFDIVTATRDIKIEKKLKRELNENTDNIYIGEGWIAVTHRNNKGDKYLNVTYINPLEPKELSIRDANYPRKNQLKELAAFIKLHDYKTELKP